jgi:hypothetical protein
MLSLRLFYFSCLFTCNLFNEAVKNSGHISPTDGMIVDHKMGRLWRKPVMVFRHTLGGTEKIHEKS